MRADRRKVSPIVLASSHRGRDCELNGLRAVLRAAARFPRRHTGAFQRRFAAQLNRSGRIVAAKTSRRLRMNASASRISHLIAGLAGLLWCLGAAAAAPDAALKAAVANPARSPNFVTRDKARHPAEELAFFGIKPNMTVVELWPGGGYWTEILGPVPRQARDLLRRSRALEQHRGRARQRQVARADRCHEGPDRHDP